MKNSIFPAFRVLACGLLLLTGCAKEKVPSDHNGTMARNVFPYHLTTEDYNDENTYYMLNDNEPSEVFFNSAERLFYTDQPLQMTFDDEHYFQIRFYSPRALPNVVVWAKLDGYDEQFKLLEIDKVMPFQQLRVQLPFATEDITAYTRSGKKIKIMANPHLDKENMSFEIECDAPYWKTLQSIKMHWRIYFSAYNPNQAGWKYPLRAYQAREAVAIALNLTYMFSTDEFAQAMYEWGPLHSDANKTEINKEALLKRIASHRGLCFGHCSGYYGLGGGETFGLHEEVFYEHYPDDKSVTNTIFHELAHCFGYGHAGNMTYEQTGPGFPSLCHKIYTDMGVRKELPAYSRRFLHTRYVDGRYASDGSARYYHFPSKYIIEDPELDEVDGGLGSDGIGFLDTDFGEKENAAALSFKLDYNDAGVAKKDYMPSGVCVYGDKLYVTNDIRKGNFSWDVYDLSTGKPVHEKKITQWTLPNGNEMTIGTPVDIIRSNDKIYLCGSNNTLFVFDAGNYECISTLGLGFDAVGLAASNGIVYAYRGLARAFPEHLLERGYAASSDNADAHANNSMTVDYSGNVYAVNYASKKLIQLDPKYLQAAKLLSVNEIVLEDNPMGAAWSADGRLFVSFGGTSKKFCEVDPETGKTIKDYTTIGNITLNNPGKCLIRRGTLFIIDRIGGLALYAVPMSELK